jgi:hypothetical protein
LCWCQTQSLSALTGQLLVRLQLRRLVDMQLVATLWLQTVGLALLLMQLLMLLLQG